MSGAMPHHNSTQAAARPRAARALGRRSRLASHVRLSQAVQAVLMAIMLPSRASAASGKVDGATIINDGIYELKLGRRMGTLTMAGQAHHFVTAKRLIRRTADIPAHQCLSFGFEYVILGTPAAAVPIRMVTRFPSPGLRHPETRAVTLRDEIVVTRAIGKVHFRSFTLESPAELVPGPWTLELWHKDQKLASQTFTLTISCADCAPHEAPPMLCERPVAAVRGPQ